MCGIGGWIGDWVNTAFKHRLRETLLGSSSRLPEFFRPEVYGPPVKALSRRTFL